MAQAQLLAMRVMFTQLGCSNGAATSLTDEHGINTITRLRTLRRATITEMCKATRRGIAGGVGGVGAVQGWPLSTYTEQQIDLASYYAWHRVRVSRGCAPEDITPATLETIRQYKEYEEEYEEPELPTVDTKDWPKTIDTMREHLMACRGQTGIPLNYVTRDDIEVPDADPDGGYDDILAEMTARAPIRQQGAFTPVYLADRAKVWVILCSWFKDDEPWTFMQAGQRSRDGRTGFRGIFNQYLGANNVHNLATKAERALKETQYTGERRRFPFAKYVAVHVDQHHILAGLEPYGYCGLDEGSKVRYLVDGIKWDRLDNACLKVLTDNPRPDFTGAVQVFNDYISQMKTDRRDSHAHSQVASTATEDRGDNHGTVNHVEDRFYTKNEYRTLSYAAKGKLKKMRAKRRA